MHAAVHGDARWWVTSSKPKLSQKLEHMPTYTPNLKLNTHNLLMRHIIIKINCVTNKPLMKQRDSFTVGTMTEKVFGLYHSQTHKGYYYIDWKVIIEELYDSLV